MFEMGQNYPPIKPSVKRMPKAVNVLNIMHSFHFMSLTVTFFFLQVGCKEKLLEWFYANKYIWISTLGGILLSQASALLIRGLLLWQLYKTLIAVNEENAVENRKFSLNLPVTELKQLHIKYKATNFYHHYTHDDLNMIRHQINKSWLLNTSDLPLFVRIENCYELYSCFNQLQQY